MAIGFGKPDAGKGGKLGRSNMAYWGTNDEAKEEARKRRRRADREALVEGVADAVAPDRTVPPRRRRKRAQPSKRFRATIVRQGSMCVIPLTFDPKAVFGKARVPVRVTINGYTYRTTIAAMGGTPFVPLRKSHRDAAGLEGSETVGVVLELDTESRSITPPADFVRALKATPGAVERWRALSYTHQREHVEAIEEAKRPETRARRITDAVRMIQRDI